MHAFFLQHCNNPKRRQRLTRLWNEKNYPKIVFAANLVVNSELTDMVPF